MNCSSSGRNDSGPARSSFSASEKSKERRATDGAETVRRAGASAAAGFDVHRVYEAFVAALREPNNRQSPIGTQDYIDGYREIVKFFDQLGYVFKFVKDDVVEKLEILQGFVNRDKRVVLQHYTTIQEAIDYETEHNLMQSNANNFARTLLRLHRALIFIAQLLQGLSERPAIESTTLVASQAYEGTLSQHHSYLARKSVKLGFRVLPSRKQLDEIIFRGHKADLFEQYQMFVQTIKQIFETMERYYAEKNYLQLP